MSGKKQRRLPKIVDKWERREDGSDANQVHAGEARDLLTSHMSKPLVHGCTLPEIGNGRLLKKRSNIIHAGSGETVSTHLPPLPVQAVAQQQARKLSKRSSACRDAFEELPKLPAVVKQDRSKEGSEQKLDRCPMPVRLLPIENMTQSSSRSSAGHKPEKAVFWPSTEMNKPCKLPDIKSVPVKPYKPKSGNLHRTPCVLPPILGRTEEANKSLKSPETRADKAKRNFKNI